MDKVRRLLISIECPWCFKVISDAYEYITLLNIHISISIYSLIDAEKVKEI